MGSMLVKVIVIMFKIFIDISKVLSSVNPKDSVQLGFRMLMGSWKMIIYNYGGEITGGESI